MIWKGNRVYAFVLSLFIGGAARAHMKKIIVYAILVAICAYATFALYIHREWRVFRSVLPAGGFFPIEVFRFAVFIEMQNVRDFLALLKRDSFSAVLALIIFSPLYLPILLWPRLLSCIPLYLLLTGTLLFPVAMGI